MEPNPFNRSWYSHKFHGPGLRYEVGVSISTGNIVWVNGPFPCGEYPDIKIFKKFMLNMIGPEEMVVADRGYKHEKCVYSIPGIDPTVSSCIRARHEIVNRRMKHFQVLSTVFRHNLKLHALCFHAVANITALMIEHSDPLFEINL